MYVYIIRYIYIIHCKTSFCKQTHFHAHFQSPALRSFKPSSLVILPTLYYLPKPMPFGLLASTPSEPKIRRIHRSYMLIIENIYINRGMNEPAHQLLISSQHYCGWWMLMDVDGCWWMLMDVDGCWWMLMDVDGCWWMLMDVDGCWWMLMDVDGCWWMLMDVDGCWWMLMDVDGCWCIINIHSFFLFKDVQTSPPPLWSPLARTGTPSISVLWWWHLCCLERWDWLDWSIINDGKYWSMDSFINGT